ncbi:MAG: M23 family metallopeptidase [Moorea sp. SIO1G6]|uniref:M23 family metallopeptidase n=1 Tax=Moorena sp. SIO1G6 TaxID=2607840 RepID=UPI0013C12D8E|nr:M23 family metallopeptidase [Moorena sp. SIO1G6]NET68506.1 M23 family metallopeptidase [Moorena sp. SIO1G6]
MSNNPNYDALKAAMKSLHDQTVFPVAGKDFRHIGSTFMCRTEIDSVSSDFHRAIDIGEMDGQAGDDDIVAAYDGVFWGYREYSGAGCTVRLRHQFPTPFTYHGKTVKYFYTWYCHLDKDSTLPIVSDWEEGKNGEAISAGQLIGKMGKSGETNVVHLHFEIRIGTNNSLEYQLANPKVTQWGFDPHIHPMLLYQPHAPAASPSLTQVGSCVPGNPVVLEYAIHREQPLLNRVEIKIIDRSTEMAVKSHVVDLTLREGMDPTKTKKLDNLDRDKTHFESIPFGYHPTVSEYKTKIIIPAEYIDSYFDSNYQLKIEVSDIWGYKVGESLSLSV